MTATRLASLGSIEQACWHELGRAGRETDHEWRVMALATVEDGLAQARSVVIRDAQADLRALAFYTDARSPKVQQLAQQPQATLLAWSRTMSWQLRLRVQLTVQTSGLEVSSRWARLKMTPRAQDYLSPLPPGTPLDGPATPAPERATREFFAVVFATVLSMDWLELHDDGQRRAAFDADGARWLQP